MTAPRLITADDMCDAAEQVLLVHLRPVVELLGWATDLREVTTWEQVPTLAALTSATFPVGAITSGGLVGDPKRNGDGSYDATWRLAVGVWDRGASYRETARRVRRHAATVRAALAMHRSLGGLAESVTWKTEAYDEIVARDTARTLGGAVVGFNVVVKRVLDPTSLATLPGPPVTSTPTTVTHRPPEE